MVAHNVDGFINQIEYYKGSIVGISLNTNTFKSMESYLINKDLITHKIDGTIELNGIKLYLSPLLPSGNFYFVFK